MSDWVKRLIVWIDTVDSSDVFFAFSSVVLFATVSYVGGFGLAAWRCWCDPVEHHGPIVSSAVVMGGSVLGGWVFGTRGWPRLVAWAQRPSLPTAQPGAADPVLREAEAEVDRLLEHDP